MSETNTKITVPTKPAWNIDRIPCDTDDPMEMPLAHLEARICALAGHLEAGTCRFLMLVADFDAREGWAEMELPSCAAWLAWKCQVAPGTAREQVRVARALKTLPLIREEFAAGRFSYAKVRALTRIATPDTEKELMEFAVPMTAGQLERFVRAHRQVKNGTADGRPACTEPKLTWRQDATGIAISVHLPNESGAVVLQALRACLDDVEHPCDDTHDTDGDGEDGGGEPKSRAELLAEADARAGLDWDADQRPFQKQKTPAANLAAALADVCGDYLSGRAARAANPDTYQVIIHAGTGTLTGTPEPGTHPAPDPGSVPAETPAGRKTPSEQARDILRQTIPLLAFPETHPAWPWRSHVEDGGHVDPAAVAMIACNATVSAMLHDEHGNLLNVGRRTRRPPDALRRAVRERDRHRCRFPGCASRRTDAHHILHWARGGQTSLDNLLSLCPYHHKLVHDTGILITPDGSGFAFFLPDGTPLPGAPPLPGGSTDGLQASHDAKLEWHTIIPPHSGERLDLHAATWICFHNLKMQAQRRTQAEQEEQRRQQTDFTPAT